jgi:hypothetical protein
MLRGPENHWRRRPATVCGLDHRPPVHDTQTISTQSGQSIMATPFLVGIGAIAAGLAGRHFLRRSARGAADEWVKGGFKAKMDRKEALAVLGLKCASIDYDLVVPILADHFFL